MQMNCFSISCLGSVLESLLTSCVVSKDTKVARTDVKYSESCTHNKAIVSERVTNVEFIDKPIAREEFFVKFLCKNLPCLFASWVTEDWICRTQWTRTNLLSNSETERVADFTALKDLCQNVKVPVANCRYVSNCNCITNKCSFNSIT